VRQALLAKQGLLVVLDSQVSLVVADQLAVLETLVTLVSKESVVVLVILALRAPSDGQEFLDLKVHEDLRVHLEKTVSLVSLEPQDCQDLREL